MILSVSRRTDIPAFYSLWFMNRIRDGFVYIRNPYNAKKVSKLPLTPDTIDLIVFWSKNPKPLVKHLKELDEIGYKYYFQFTITPYDRDIEEYLVDKDDVLETFVQLSNEIGKEKVIWRYDPILITDKYDESYHYSAFERMCKRLAGKTEKVIISFVDDYRKISKSMKQHGIKDIKVEDMKRMAEFFSRVAKESKIDIETCAEKIDLSEFGIKPGRCIDGKLVERIIGCSIKDKDKLDGNREACGCMKSIDIGQYDTCVHGCLYCYANSNKEMAKYNYSLHDVTSPILCGEYKNCEITTRKNIKSLKSSENGKQVVFFD